MHEDNSIYIGTKCYLRQASKPELVNLDNTVCIPLSATEYKILKYFIEHKNSPVHLDDLANQIWGINFYADQKDPSNLKSHISRLRNKLEQIQTGLRNCISTNYGFGSYTLTIKTSGKSISSNNTDDDAIDCIRANLCNILFPGKPFRKTYRYNGKHLFPDNKFYTYRADITKHIQNLFQNNKQALAIIGNPGTGKSCYLAHFVLENSDQILAQYFCEWDSEDKNNAIYLIREIAYQILMKNPVYCKALQKKLNNKNIEDLSSYSVNYLFNIIIAEPLAQVCFSKKQIIIIDGIDELQNSDLFMHTLIKYIPSIPENLFFVISARRNLLDNHTWKHFETINIDSRIYSKDVTEYVTKRLCSLSLTNKQIESLIEKCSGNFLYAKFLCDDITSNQLVSLNQLPNNLDSIYYLYFQRIFRNGNDYSELYRNGLSVLLALREYITLQQFQEIMSWDATIALNFFDKIGDMINLEEFPQRIIFYHKSLIDWMQAIDLAGIYYVNIQIGITIIYNHIYNKYFSGTLQQIPYSLVKCWKFYGKRSNQNKQYLKMQEDINFILWTAEEYRRHSDFALSISVLNTVTNICTSADFVYFKATLILNDIYIDLNDNRVFDTLEYLLNYVANYSVKDPYCTIHLYENAGWIYMNHEKAKTAEEYLKKALQVYEHIPFCTEKKLHYAHTLYIYSNILYRFKKYDLCREKLLVSQELIRDVELEESSLSYALGQKLMGWIEFKQENYTKAESYFLEALSIQDSIYEDSFLYVVNTLRCLAENEFQLFKQNNTIDFLKKAKKHLQRAKTIYNGLDARFTSNFKYLSQLEEKINDYYENYL